MEIHTVFFFPEKKSRVRFGENKYSYKGEEINIGGKVKETSVPVCVL
jgi:hypothetical protein